MVFHWQWQSVPIRSSGRPMVRIYFIFAATVSDWLNPKSSQIVHNVPHRPLDWTKHPMMMYLNVLRCPPLKLVHLYLLISYILTWDSTRKSFVSSGIGRHLTGQLASCTMVKNWRLAFVSLPHKTMIGAYSLCKVSNSVVKYVIFPCKEKALGNNSVAWG